ncbi:MAG TPA: TonB-dependent receptor [Algoriphagus sp.]|jgi:iron complex outermembrane receptor protein|uniref:TonB-dependent receptor family protein n=2 Tax=Cyclobacteriaceae TaxID=563798 RepID=UPI000C64CAEC|nr:MULTISPECIES: TonB-dependent receptor [Algoriphagus]MAL15965.1 TonB-dependent receptor [Algoriphagus sp.]QYH40585.1 TonB-dependent receptor [Algoriphagus sp. NBT04N3]HCB47459.1 TonB-dependent receptor [Algoriphagus sp.]HCD89208.1 TonB-dependent receptor [Algoriphagus sp.]HCH43817.1 TonB-dependent receptor [Algoriphagus sp.]|tara:strand:+ start:254 stop:2491 length:2238 start_codon:yes stop_codon:yes gene_type:complete
MKILFTLLIALSASFSIAQTQFTIQDADTQKPLEKVLIRVNDKSFFSDQEGKVQIPFSEPISAIFFLEGYETIQGNFEPGSYILRLKSLSYSLSDFTVTAFETERPLLKQSAAISLVGEQDFSRFNETSIVNSFNTKPGVRIEERALASYRVSIRGSSLRAPFGVRNVKIYWNDVPFTAPDGTTALNLLDLSNIRTAEVIKGPSGSIYGAGNGGVINLKSPADPKGGLVSAEYGGGSFGLNRSRIAISQQVGKGGFEASLVKQKLDGYREHSAMDRTVFQLGGFMPVSQKQELRTQLLVSDLDYQIPGALNAQQLAEDPRQARPGSVNQNSSIAQKSVFASLGHLYRFSEKAQNNTTLYLTTNDFENPFILDYKKELGFGYGGRSRFTFDWNLAGKPFRIIAGGEYQTALTDAQNFGNRNGLADTVRFADKLKATQGFLFQQAEWEPTEKILLTLGLSQNFSSFEIDRQINASGGPTGLQTRTFDPILIPRIAANYSLNTYSSIFGSISSGFSPPTIDEVRTNEGSLNLDLEAERGVNYELGYRMGKNRLNVDVTAFYFRLNETITTFTNEQGVVLFRNSGSTDQKGIEAAIDYVFIQQAVGFIRNFKAGTAFTGHYFQFKDYEQRGNDFSGNDLTGVAPNNLVSKLDFRFAGGFYLNFTHQFTDEIPLNDANTVYQDAYNLVNTRLGIIQNLGKRTVIELYAGVDNLLNESYSLGNDLNPFGGRFYQPAPTRNYYGGLKASFRY